MKKIFSLLVLCLIFFTSCSDDIVRPGGDYQFEDSVLQSIEVSTLPTKVVYSVGESFDPTGLVLTATYLDYFADGTSRTSTRSIKYSLYKDVIKFSGTDFSSSGEKEITVIYEKKTAVFSVTVE